MTTAAARNLPSCPFTRPGPMLPPMTIESSATRSTAAAPTRSDSASSALARRSAVQIHVMAISATAAPVLISRLIVVLLGELLYFLDRASVYEYTYLIS